MIGIIFYWPVNVVLCGMRSLAYLMTACFLFFSAFSGMIPAATVSKSKGGCCQCMAGKPMCHHSKNKEQKDGCEKSGCSMLSSCGACGFLAVETVTIKVVASDVICDQVSFYWLGCVTTYATDSWKPPKAC